jgi:hypothetical protein
VATKILLQGWEQNVIFGIEFPISVGLLITKFYTTQTYCMAEFCVIKRQKDGSEETRFQISLGSTCAFRPALSSTAICRYYWADQIDRNVFGGHVARLG